MVPEADSVDAVAEVHLEEGGKFILLVLLLWLFVCVRG